MIYCQKQRAWNKLKNRRDNILGYVVRWNQNFSETKGIEMRIGMYAAWLELAQVDTTNFWDGDFPSF
jgi:hypothetical protein